MENNNLINKIISQYNQYILLGVIIFSITFIMIKQYVYIELITSIILSSIILLKNKISFIDYYLKQIIIIILSVIITLGLICSYLYDMYNFLYLTKGYIECIILESSEYSLLTVSAADDHDGRYSIQKSTQMMNGNNVRDFYERYMMKNHITLDEDFLVIEKVIGKIKEYKPFSDNVYYVELEEGGGLFVILNRYSQWTIFKFEVNT